jgi:hypothetical protein
MVRGVFGVRHLNVLDSKVISAVFYMRAHDNPHHL